ncbi:hypothetical protein [Calothrix sp. PCC 7507]|uniref:hypothetical protein n=1 Tax=Calothrix sp. PCC 7507 TaxID=99598 RepID=UPI00029EEADB|nr:hypothetical protein [Calothrix sp. PCC 7507]AFY32771.1 hypothetical protein Cal7507_2340 [Calothrix sp. PCC 7507]
MDEQTLQQFEEELRQAVNDALRTSSIGTVISKYGIPDNAIKWQYTLDLSKIQSSNSDESQQGQELLGGIQQPPRKLADCTLVWCEFCCPGGCWTCI